LCSRLVEVFCSWLLIEFLIGAFHGGVR
jgi:hypothetical protein